MLKNIRIKALLTVIVLSGIISCCAYFFSFFKDEKTPITVYGNVDIRDVVLGFRVFGRVKELKVNEGDSVKKGDLLALLDKEPYEKDLALKEAQLLQAKANLTNAEREYLRQKKLFEQKVNAQKDYDYALSVFDQASAQTQAAQASLEQAKINLKDTELIAPEDGTILTRIREPGSIVPQGTPIFTMSLNTPVWVRTYVDEPNLGNVYNGQKAAVTTDSGNTYEGQIGFISPQAEFTPKNVETSELRTSLVYRVRVIVENPDNGLRQGMPVTVQIVRNSNK